MPRGGICSGWLCPFGSGPGWPTGPGIPALMGLFLEVNAGVLLATLGALGVHQATAVWDVAYADDRREVTPTEQHVHGLLEQVPLMATSFLFILHWDQAR